MRHRLAAVSFLARHSGRTLEAYRHDLRGFFQWATDHGIAVLAGSRGHIELFRIMAALDAGVPLRDVQIAARHADPRTTTVYDRRRQNFDRHAA